LLTAAKAATLGKTGIYYRLRWGGYMQLKLEKHVVDDVTVIRCKGRIVFGEEAVALREMVKGLLPDTKNIVMDLAETTHIDSGGLGTLVGLYTSSRKLGSTIRLANLHERMLDLLQMTKLLTVFDVFDSEDKAIKSFSQSMSA
jgi:anti-sigma B factor antagonist